MIWSVVCLVFVPVLISAFEELESIASIASRNVDYMYLQALEQVSFLQVRNLEDGEGILLPRMQGRGMRASKTPPSPIKNGQSAQKHTFLKVNSVPSSNSPASPLFGRAGSTNSPQKADMTHGKAFSSGQAQSSSHEQQSASRGSLPRTGTSGSIPPGARAQRQGLSSVSGGVQSAFEHAARQGRAPLPQGRNPSRGAAATKESPLSPDRRSQASSRRPSLTSYASADSLSPASSMDSFKTAHSLDLGLPRTPSKTGSAGPSSGAQSSQKQSEKKSEKKSKGRSRTSMRREKSIANTLNNQGRQAQATASAGLQRQGSVSTSSPRTQAIPRAGSQSSPRVQASSNLSSPRTQPNKRPSPHSSPRVREGSNVSSERGQIPERPRQQTAPKSQDPRNRPSTNIMHILQRPRPQAAPMLQSTSSGSFPRPHRPQRSSSQGNAWTQSFIQPPPPPPPRINPAAWPELPTPQLPSQQPVPPRQAHASQGTHSGSFQHADRIPPTSQIPYDMLFPKENLQQTSSGPSSPQENLPEVSKPTGSDPVVPPPSNGRRYGPIGSPKHPRA